jgi:hypothetical protein
MDIHSNPDKPGTSKVTFENYREYVAVQWTTPGAVAGFVLRGLHVRPQMEFPHTEVVRDSRLARKAEDIQSVNNCSGISPETSDFLNGLAQTISAHIEQTARDQA